VATDLILCQANQAKKVKEQVEALMDDDEAPNESYKQLSCQLFQFWPIKRSYIVIKILHRLLYMVASLNDGQMLAISYMIVYLGSQA
jgi:hypothetical protein